MSEYICKEDLIKAIENDCPNLVYYSKKEAIECIEAMDVVDVEPVIHAKWIYNPNGMDWGLGAWQCSNCGYVNTSFGMDNRIHAKFYAGSKRCGSCGAKMGLE